MKNLLNNYFFCLAASPRFRDIRINYHISKTDTISEKQFSATTFILNNTYAYIAFRHGAELYVVNHNGEPYTPMNLSLREWG